MTPAVGASASSTYRWTMVGVVLFIEYLLISVRFDAWWISARGGPWALIGQVGQLAKYTAVVAVATIMLVSRSERAPAKVPPINVRALLAHSVAYVSFWFATSAIFGARQAPAGSPTAWFVVWGGLGVCAVLALVIGFVGTSSLRRVITLRRALAMAVLGALALIAGEWTQTLWVQSPGATLRLVTSLLGAVFSDVSADPIERTVTLGGFSIYVAPECGGLEGVGLVTVLMTGYLYAFRSKLRFPNALFLLPIAVVAVWVLNGLRLAALIAIGARADASVATQAFHARAGWVLFCIVALGVSAIGRHSALFSSEKSATEETENPAAPYLVPLLSLIGVALITGMFANPLDFLYGLRVVAAGLAIYAYRRQYRGMLANFAPEAVIVGIVVAVGWVATGVKHPEADGVVRDAFGGRPPVSYASWLTFRIIGSALIVPICEELAFRGYLLRRLINRDFTSVSTKAWTPVALLGSSLAFGLLHDRWIAASLAGLCYAAVSLRTGNLGAAIVSHAITNGIIAAWVVFAGDWSHWV